MATALTALLVSACSGDRTGEGEELPAEPAFDDVLVVRTEPGSKAVYAPAYSPYYYTHGFLLCRDGDSSDDYPVLRTISYNMKLKPLDLQPVIRRIPAAADRLGAPPDDWASIGGLLGRPGDFDHWTARGDFSESFDGTEVTAPCQEASDPTAALMELEIVMKVPRTGSDIDGFTITYEIDGEAQELHVPWRMVGCGTRADRDVCSQG